MILPDVCRSRNLLLKFVKKWKVMLLPYVFVYDINLIWWCMRFSMLNFTMYLLWWAKIDFSNQKMKHWNSNSLLTMSRFSPQWCFKRYLPQILCCVYDWCDRKLQWLEYILEMSISANIEIKVMHFKFSVNFRNNFASNSNLIYPNEKNLILK